MAKRHKARAKRKREELRELLGNFCADGFCPNTDLEFDCIKPMGDKHHKFDSCRRNTFYWRQYKVGNLQLLCNEHHQEKTAKETHGRPKKYWEKV